MVIDQNTFDLYSERIGNSVDRSLNKIVMWGAVIGVMVIISVVATWVHLYDTNVSTDKALTRLDRDQNKMMEVLHKLRLAQNEVVILKARVEVLEETATGKCSNELMGRSIDGTPLSSFEVTKTKTIGRNVSTWMRYSRPGLRQYYTVSVDK